MHKLYTYKDWLSGKVVLKYGKFEGKPLVVDWSNFATNDKIKIQTEQGKIYNKQVKKVFQRWAIKTDKEYEKSDVKKVYLKERLLEITQKLNESHPTRGLLNLDSIQSPKSKYQCSYILDHKKKLVIPDIVYLSALKKTYDYLKSKNSIRSNKNDLNTTRWFQVGLLLANGKLFAAQKKFKSQVALANHFFGADYRLYRPYINASLSNERKSDLNIFSSEKKINALLEHMQRKRLEIHTDFTNKVEASELKNYK